MKSRNKRCCPSFLFFCPHVVLPLHLHPLISINHCSSSHGDWWHQRSCMFRHSERSLNVLNSNVRSGYRKIYAQQLIDRSCKYSANLFIALSLKAAVCVQLCNHCLGKSFPLLHTDFADCFCQGTCLTWQYLSKPVVVDSSPNSRSSFVVSDVCVYAHICVFPLIASPLILVLWSLRLFSSVSRLGRISLHASVSS